MSSLEIADINSKSIEELRALAYQTISGIKSGGLSDEMSQILDDLKDVVEDIKDVKEDVADNTEDLEKYTKDLSRLSEIKKEAVNKAYEIQSKDEAIKSMSADAQTIAKQIVSAVKSNEALTDMIASGGASLAELSQSVAKSTNSVSKSLSQSTGGVNVTNMQASLSQNSRLAMLSNPHNDNLRLARAIKELDGTLLAGDSDALSSVISGYTKRFDYDNSLWANTFAMGGSVKNSPNPGVFGFSVGYDRTFDNFIIGTSITYAYTDSSDSEISNESNSVQFGVYSRAYLGDSEIDLSANINTARNTLKRDVAVGTAIAKHEGKYNSNGWGVSAGYGYVFDLGSELYLKPNLALSYSYNKNNKFKENGVLANEYSATKAKTATASFGVEIRKYVDEDKYFYVSPSYEREIYKKNSDLSTRLLISYDTTAINYSVSNKKHGYFNLSAGGSVALNANTELNLNVGTKLGKDVKLYSGSIGIKYKF